MDEGQGLARHESNFESEGDAVLSLDELLALLGPEHSGDQRSREDAIACYLSGSDGWRDALALLGGTFAGDSTGLRGRKGD